MIRVALPYHLRNLAKINDAEIQIDVPAPVTIAAALDVLEARYPVLRGTIRDHGTRKRRPFIRFFACKDTMTAWRPPLLRPARSCATCAPGVRAAVPSWSR
jgi:hypothetical protein